MLGPPSNILKVVFELDPRTGLTFILSTIRLESLQ